jgi:excinuclease UvrABC nuclease subunit
MSKLLPWLQKKATRIVDLESIGELSIPERPGVYILLSEKTQYIYPRGDSRVFYIGCGRKLRQRIWEHRKYYLQARDDPQFPYYWPRYEYAAAHVCKVCWIACRNEQLARDLESKLLISFANYYGAKPVTNGQGAWPK